jgi:hypothetical protein
MQDADPHLQFFTILQYLQMERTANTNDTGVPCERFSTQWFNKQGLAWLRSHVVARMEQQ